MSRTIRVNTDDLFDAALRFERLALSLEDLAADIGAVRADIEGTDAYLMDMADKISRTISDLVSRTQAASAVLKLASGRYEDAYRRAYSDFTHIDEAD